MTNSSLPTRGRPSLLDVQMINRIARAVQAGKTRSETAAKVGVSFSTLQGWITRGRRVREQGGATDGRDLLALRLIEALEIAERKRDAIAAIVSDEDLGKGVPEGKKPLGRPALLTKALLEAVTPMCVEGRLRDAAEAAGVDKRSVLRWLARGREVHANGTARTEYERLCGILHARVEAGRPPVALPEVSPSAQGVPRAPSGAAITATAEGMQELVAAIRKGATRVQAAEQIGISYRTFARWLTLGARVNEAGRYSSEHERLCGELRTSVDQADEAKRQRIAAALAEPEPANGGVVEFGEPVGEEPPVEPVIVIGRPRRRSFRERWIAPLFGPREPHRA
ncbi:helix-turn-helix domain-containing protein [[Kitasatospora] papulosa]|uniref:helix-turn-helix domain-containing protein n=1 Tax=Streptomyces TaxID=1883 RepID=UPI00331B5B7C